MIFWHSGTGNSESVAAMLAELLGERTRRIDKTTPNQFDIEPNERIVWVFPVYSWGVPPTVSDFLRRVAINGDAEGHYMVCTCGDDVGLTDRQWRREIRNRGWKAVGTWSVQMPNNYVLLPGFDVDPLLLAAEKKERAKSRVEQVARAIRHHARVDDVVHGSVAWIKSRVLYPLFVKFMMSPKPFATSDFCISCGKCCRVCPQRNVAMNDDGHPEWGRDCAMCLACYHVCPVHAVRYGKRTLHKGQYFLYWQTPLK